MNDQENRNSVMPLSSLTKKIIFWKKTFKEKKMASYLLSDKAYR